MTLSDDLVRENLVKSFAHPEGNTTGISILASELDDKRQELLMEMLPDARRIGALADVNTSGPEHLRTLEDDARSRGVELWLERLKSRQPSSWPMRPGFRASMCWRRRCSACIPGR